MIAVTIADDHPLQREGYRAVLQSQPDIEVVAEAHDGMHLLRVARAHPADVVLTALQMPRMNGLVAAERLREDKKVLAAGPAPRVILLTAVELEEHIAAAAFAGVHAVLYKDVSPELLFETIRDAAHLKDPTGA